MKIVKSILLGIVYMLSVSSGFAQNTDAFSKEFYIVGKDTLNYRLLLPNNFDKAKTYPVVLFLHGAGERGNDNQTQLTHGGELFIKYRDSFPSIVIFPQCPKEDYWANVMIDRSKSPLEITFPKDSPPTKALTLVMELMDEMVQKSYVKKDQLYVCGLSMGGMGTFEILFRKPEMFAAAFSICGAGNPETAETYAKNTPMWIFHGSNDDVVNPQYSIDMVSGILKYGGKPNFILFSKDNHNSWDSAFAEPQLLPWLFSNIKSQF